MVSLGAAQVSLKTFEGIDAATDPIAGFTVDPNGAVGTKQYLEWVDQAYQGYDKGTFAAVYPSAQKASTPWVQNNMPDCQLAGGNGIILFDHLALRWIIAVRVGGPNYFYCIAISNTDDLKASNFAWYTYELSLNPILTVNGKTYYPDYPKIATWPDGYYVTLDLEDTSKGFQEVGIVACAFDRINMVNGAPARTPQCFRSPQTPNGLFLGHSLLPADIDGTTPPPVGTVESFISIQNPSGSNTTSAQLNIWQMHVDWTTPANSTFTEAPLAVTQYTPGCYNLSNVSDTYCVPEPSSPTTKNVIDSVGDRLMHRFAFRQFSTYQSYIVTQAVQPSTTRKQTGIRWYELRPSGATLGVANFGTISPDTLYYRFVPSAAQDKAGNMAIGYSGSSTGLHPSIGASYLNLPLNSHPTEFGILMGKADAENSQHWGGYTSMTVDPVDDCTFWYVNEYLSANQTGNSHTWRTRIAKFRLTTCQ
jgi:hypothetical protein